MNSNYFLLPSPGTSNTRFKTMLITSGFPLDPLASVRVTIGVFNTLTVSQRELLQEFFTEDATPKPFTFATAVSENQIETIKQFLENSEIDPTFDSYSVVIEAAGLGFQSMIQLLLTDVRVRKSVHHWKQRALTEAKGYYGNRNTVEFLENL